MHIVFRDKKTVKPAEHHTGEDGPVSYTHLDDEAEIRDGIQRKIDWTGSGFTFVGSAENGQEALELAESLHPDVVMTDIKMPFMDGLTLGRHLTERFPGVKLVFFSGFDDSEYAQKAIQIGAAEYILKPVRCV